MDDAKEFLIKISKLTGEDFLADPVSPLDILKEKSYDVMKYRMELFVTYFQCQVVRKLEKYEKEKKFDVNRWNREEGGGGISCVLQDGKVFEKAGVNVSVLWGEMKERQVKPMKDRGKSVLDGKNIFFATGISAILHPKNPNIPSIHWNYRYFEIMHESGNHIWWFGGSTDMTPYYLYEQDFIHFHRTQKDACNKHNTSYYSLFKKSMDDYHYMQHRDEYRGVGGIWYEDMHEEPMEDCFGLLVSLCNAVLPSYIPIVDSHLEDVYTEKEREWQLLRRGRYIEFNLLYDRGTKFGINTPGIRIENVLVALPLTASWKYMHVIEDGSPEAKMMEVLKNPRDWANIEMVTSNS